MKKYYKITKENYSVFTCGNFKGVKELNEKLDGLKNSSLEGKKVAINVAMKGKWKLVYISDSRKNKNYSFYFINNKENKLLRVSNHWGNCGSSIWKIDNKEPLEWKAGVIKFKKLNHIDKGSLEDFNKIVEELKLKKERKHLETLASMKRVADIRIATEEKAKMEELRKQIVKERNKRKREAKKQRQKVKENIKMLEELRNKEYLKNILEKSY